MGIKGLTQLIADFASGAMKDMDIKAFFGRKVAIDASMSIYQFLIAVTRAEGAGLTDSDGEVTSHLMGFLYRTIRMAENGIKPVYVFDGKPPVMKSGELAKRAERRAEAEKGLAEAQEKGDMEGAEKFQKRLIKVTKQQNDECKRLLSLMGMPYIEAPCEAEAQCAAMTKAGVVFASATEDMDCLTFGSNIVLRHLTASEAKKLPIREINLDRVLSSLELQRDEFIDLCILLGCDYCDSPRGIGPKRAVSLIQKHKSIEEIMKHKSSLPTNVQFPENWEFEEARRLFKEPDVSDPMKLEVKWSNPDEEGLIKFLVDEKGFNLDRVKNAVKKLTKSRQGATQGRLDSFFKPLPSSQPVKRQVGLLHLYKYNTII
jgi:flap endonuclease-1